MRKNTSLRDEKGEIFKGYLLTYLLPTYLVGTYLYVLLSTTTSTLVLKVIPLGKYLPKLQLTTLEAVRVNRGRMGGSQCALHEWSLVSGLVRR